MFDRPYNDDRQHAPATQRNSGFIIDVLKDVLPKQGHILEIASGSGEHIVAFAKAMPALTWQPSDPFGESRTSIDSWAQDIQPTPISPALDLDMTQPDWPSLLPKAVNAILAINMIHIAPWEACCGLLAGSGKVLDEGEILYTYGPYQKNGAHTSDSNKNFEAWLKEKDTRFGVRDMADIQAESLKNGLVLDQEIAMPANNFSLIFKKV